MKMPTRRRAGGNIQYKPAAPVAVGITHLSGLLRLTERACWEGVLLLRRSLGQAGG